MSEKKRKKENMGKNCDIHWLSFLRKKSSYPESVISSGERRKTGLLGLFQALISHHKSKSFLFSDSV